MIVYIFFKFTKNTSTGRIGKGIVRFDSYHFSPWSKKEEGRKIFLVVPRIGESRLCQYLSKDIHLQQYIKQGDGGLQLSETFVQSGGYLKDNSFFFL